MTPDDFARVVKTEAFDSAVADVLHGLREAPPGRRPHPKGIALSAWYGTLSVNDQLMLAEVVRDTAHLALFGILCMLDGVRAIDDPPHSELVLTMVDPAGNRTDLSASVTGIDLHDAFNGWVHPSSEQWPASSST